MSSSPATPFTNLLSTPSTLPFLDTLLPTNNPFFTGGFSLAVIGAGFAFLKKSYSTMVTVTRRQLLCTLEITSKDKAFLWVLEWLNKNGTGKLHQSVETKFITSNSIVDKSIPKALFSFVPGPGVHLLTYKNKLIAVERTREHQSTDLNSGRPWEKVTLTTLAWNNKLFLKLLEEAFDIATQQQEGKTIIYTNWGAEWRPFGLPRRKRPLSSVILGKDIASSIVSDVKEWIASASWYNSRGIPYRRGYLLHGPPGSGKSSFITAIAGDIGYNICVLNLAEAGLTDDRLALALSTVPPMSILLEDIDAAFVQREASSFSRVTFSGLLNALDGVASSEERLVFMTTNHLDRLDPALIRPGRVDKVSYLGNASRKQLQNMFATFYPDTKKLVDEDPKVRTEVINCRKARGVQSDIYPDMAEEFSYRVEEIAGKEKVSMAQLQGYLLRYKYSSFEAFKNIIDLVTVKDAAPKPSNPEKVSELFAKARGSRPLNATDIDKIFFNPQSNL